MFGDIEMIIQLLMHVTFIGMLRFSLTSRNKTWNG